MTEHKHAEVLRAIADGKKVEFGESKTIWLDPPDYMSPITHPDFEWRIKTTKTPVDLSVLINSGIDCQFWDEVDAKKYIGKLIKVNSDFYPEYEDGFDTWSYCRPRINHCHSWQGGKCPLPDGFIVHVKARDQTFSKGNAQDYDWDYKNSDKDIIMFKVIGLDDGYCYPWEIEE